MAVATRPDRTQYLTIEKAKDFVRKHHAQHGRIPTREEITDGMGFKNPRVGTQMLTALADEGFINQTQKAVPGHRFATYEMGEDA